MNYHPVQATNYPLDPIQEFDEVTVEFRVENYLSFESNVIITDAAVVYVNVASLFKNLGIYGVSEKEHNSLKGFIEDEKTHYQIDVVSKEIRKGSRTVKSIHGIIKVFGDIYVEMNLMNEVFDLNMLFNFRSLSVKMKASFELPFVKQARLEKMRKNLSNLQARSDVVIDTIIGRNYHLFKGGTMDWSITSSQSEGRESNNRFALRLGGELLYGEAKIGVHVYNKLNFEKRQLYYNWRWIDNDNNFIKQAQIGKIGASSISFLKAPLVGMSFNNSPNTIRKARGTYTISEYTGANWTVELYINDVLVDYTVADASGFYVFNIPIVYGYNKITLKQYGPLGEERIEERKMNAPATFMPVKVMEYKISGGVLEDTNQSRFGRGEVSYGVSRFVTIGGGMEYLSSIPDTPLIPFVNMAFQPFSKMIINMEFAHNIRVKGTLNYNFGKSTSIAFDYSKYVEGQQATLNNTSEERKVRLSFPIKISKIRCTTRWSYAQLVYGSFSTNRINAMFSGRYKNVTGNATIASYWTNGERSFVTSKVIFSHRMRNGFTIRPSFRYHISEHKMMSFRTEIEKRVERVSFSASYERNVRDGINNATFSLKYNLPFGRIGFYTGYRNKKYNFSENAQGSIAFGAGNGSIKTDYNTGIGKGGISLYPFLDLNQNGTKDIGEQMVLLNNVRVPGGKVTVSPRDSIIRVSNLNAFTNYTVRFSPDELANIALKFKNKTYQILVDPNQYKKVEIPILVQGEISGIVYLNTGGIQEGQGRIKIHIEDEKGHVVAEILSESDGYFSYLGLKPGKYKVRIDQNQLKNIEVESSPLLHSIVVKTLLDGDVIEGLDFIIKKPTRITIKKETVRELTTAFTKDTNLETDFTKIATLKIPFYSVQIGVFHKKVTLKQLLNLRPIYYEVLSEKTTRYISGIYTTKKEAKTARARIVALGIKDAYVVAYKNGKKVTFESLKSPVNIKK
ncbi:MAG: carboxypeptidase regulatory-like domain-containing protein [Flavobacteriaceae bacterium]|nr:carboxypeptidase regulatory-like domain-containing protein [Flavobacteriaceae bacterium]